jgi:hypothetical protein
MTRRLTDKGFSTRPRARCTAASLREQAGDRGAWLQRRSRRVACLSLQAIGRESRQLRRRLAPIDYHREEKE